jgi:hypothetical protein
MTKRTSRILAGAGTAALIAVATAFATTPAQAAEAADVRASCRGSAERAWLIPDDGGRAAGTVRWHDYNQDTGDDQDDFELSDQSLDGQSVSLWVKNNYTGKTYYKHIYTGGATACIGIGSLPNGKTASWRACSWDDGDIIKCRRGTVTE